MVPLHAPPRTGAASPPDGAEMATWKGSAAAPPAGCTLGARGKREQLCAARARVLACPAAGSTHQLPPPRLAFRLGGQLGRRRDAGAVVGEERARAGRALGGPRQPQGAALPPLGTPRVPSPPRLPAIVEVAWSRLRTGLARFGGPSTGHPCSAISLSGYCGQSQLAPAARRFGRLQGHRHSSARAQMHVTPAAGPYAVLAGRHTRPRPACQGSAAVAAAAAASTAAPAEQCQCWFSTAARKPPPVQCMSTANALAACHNAFLMPHLSLVAM